MNERKIFSITIDIMAANEDGSYRTVSTSRSHRELSVEEIGKMYGTACQTIHKNALGTAQEIGDAAGPSQAIAFGNGYCQATRGETNLVASRLSYKTKPGGEA